MMKDELLAKDDLQNLILFQNDIYECSKNYFVCVLHLLKKYFGYHLTAYEIYAEPSIQQPAEPCIMDSLCFDKYFLEQCLDASRIDKVLTPYISQLRNRNDWDGVAYSQDIPDFEDTTFYHIFQARRVRYAAYIVPSHNPETIVFILKSEEEGCFSEREKSLIRQISRIIRSSLENYMRLQAALITGDTFKSMMDNEKIGIMIFDNAFDYLWSNETFVNILYPIYKTPKLRSLVRQFCRAMAAEQGSSLTEISTPVIVMGGTYEMLIQPVHLSESYNIGKQYWFCQLTPCVDKTPLSQDASDKNWNLTQRERKIWELITDGLTNGEISAQLLISESTVKTHVSNLFRKLDVGSRMDAILLWKKQMHE